MLRVVSRAVCTSPLTHVKTLSPGASTDCAADGEVSPTTTLTVFLAPPTGHGTHLITTSRTGGCDPRNAARPTSVDAGFSIDSNIRPPVWTLLGRSSATKKEVAGAHVPGVHAGLPFVATVERGGTSYTVDMPTPRHGRSTVLFVSFEKKEVNGRVTSLLPTHVGTETTVVPERAQANIRRGTRNPMANTLHPLDVEVEEMFSTRKQMIRLFASDGVICEAERTVLERFDNHYNDIAQYRQREVAADSFKRNGLTKVTRNAFADAGCKVIDLHAERQARRSNVVSFPTPRPEAG